MAASGNREALNEKEWKRMEKNGKEWKRLIDL
jgi:hypothetical protein